MGACSVQTAAIVALPSKIRKAVHFEGTLSRDANSLVRAEESHDVVPMFCATLHAGRSREPWAWICCRSPLNEYGIWNV